jgi:hypothetical protein
MNYADLFRVTMPETALDVAALLVLFVDLGFLRKAALQTRIMASVLIGVLGCGAAVLVMPYQAAGGLTYPGSTNLLLSAGGYTAIAQVGILMLTVLTLFLLVDSDFTKHVGEFVAMVLMAATGGLLISAAQDLLVIFVGRTGCRARPGPHVSAYRFARAPSRCGGPEHHRIEHRQMAAECRRRGDVRSACDSCRSRIDRRCPKRKRDSLHPPQHDAELELEHR